MSLLSPSPFPFPEQEYYSSSQQKDFSQSNIFSWHDTNDKISHQQEFQLFESSSPLHFHDGILHSIPPPPHTMTYHDQPQPDTNFSFDHQQTYDSSSPYNLSLASTESQFSHSIDSNHPTLCENPFRSSSSSTSSSSPSIPSSSLTKNQRRCKRDRGRRKKFAVATHQLSCHLPPSSSHQQSQVQVFQSAIGMIRSLKCDIDDLKMQIHTRENHALMQQVVRIVPELISMTHTFNEAGIYYLVSNPNMPEGLSIHLSSVIVVLFAMTLLHTYHKFDLVRDFSLVSGFIAANAVLYETLDYRSLDHLITYRDHCPYIKNPMRILPSPSVEPFSVVPFHQLPDFDMKEAARSLYTLLINSPPDTICRVYIRAFTAHFKEFELTYRVRMVSRKKTDENFCLV